METAQEVLTALDVQVSTAKEMADNLPDGSDRFEELMKGSFFSGYVVGLSDYMGNHRFSNLIDDSNKEKNMLRLLQGVIANLFFPNSEPDWDSVLAWEAQVKSYKTSGDENYDLGFRKGNMLGEEMINGPQEFSTSFLGSEMMKPL